MTLVALLLSHLLHTSMEILNCPWIVDGDGNYLPVSVEGAVSVGGHVHFALVLFSGSFWQLFCMGSSLYHVILCPFLKILYCISLIHHNSTICILYIRTNIHFGNCAWSLPHTYVYVCTYVCMDVNEWMDACIYVHMHACTYVRVNCLVSFLLLSLALVPWWRCEVFPWWSCPPRTARYCSAGWLPCSPCSHNCCHLQRGCRHIQKGRGKPLCEHVLAVVFLVGCA